MCFQSVRGLVLIRTINRVFPWETPSSLQLVRNLAPLVWKAHVDEGTYQRYRNTEWESLPFQERSRLRFLCAHHVGVHEIVESVLSNLIFLDGWERPHYATTNMFGEENAANGETLDLLIDSCWEGLLDMSNWRTIVRVRLVHVSNVKYANNRQYSPSVEENELRGDKRGDAI